jgi:hypothetical protein
MMLDTQWEMVPFPFFQIASVHQPVKRIDLLDVLSRVVEDTTGLAGVIAAAVESPDLDEQDLRHATRLLAEQSHALLALWRAWDTHAGEADAGEAVSGSGA